MYIGTGRNYSKYIALHYSIAVVLIAVLVYYILIQVHVQGINMVDMMVFHTALSQPG